MENTDKSIATNYFRLSNEGIHLLRNKFEYKFISYDQIKMYEIKRGKVAKNWLVILILGIAFIIGAYYFGEGIILSFLYDSNPLYIEAIIAPTIFLIIGIYMLYMSLKKELLLYFKTAAKSYKFSVRQIKQENRLGDLNQLLNMKVR